MFEGAHLGRHMSAMKSAVQVSTVDGNMCPGLRRPPLKCTGRRSWMLSPLIEPIGLAAGLQPQHQAWPDLCSRGADGPNIWYPRN